MKGVKDYIPHRDPFLFVDEIIEMDDSHIVTGLTLKPEMDLYRGHYPSNPITPGVILCESVFQSAGVYVAMKQELEGSDA
ncbi:MAG: beta-hydroxyacyl-ACP dehydratase, partial [Opitutales bacterium]|nr:beta-hydroxyacyl-ACP dehydratase [Opitutales bacterium]